MLSNELQLVLGLCAVVVTLVAIYKAVKMGGIAGANTELEKLQSDPARLDRMEATLNQIRLQSPHHEALIGGGAQMIIDFAKTIQQVQLEALKIGLVIPFNEETARLLRNISTTTNVLTDQLPNTPPLVDVGQSG